MRECVLNASMSRGVFIFEDKVRTYELVDRGRPLHFRILIVVN